jgi:hypothetical protein
LLKVEFSSMLIKSGQTLADNFPHLRRPFSAD